MPLGTLQHFTIEPSDLERTKNSYCNVLGIEVRRFVRRSISLAIGSIPAASPPST